MELNDYATVDYPTFNQSSSGNQLSDSSLEKFIIFVIAVLGIIGSSFIIASSTGSNNQPEFHNLSILAASAIQDIEEPAALSKNRFKDYVHIAGKKKVDNTLTFTMQFPLEQGVRYWMDMGDGTRMMVRRSKFKYAYKEKGKYNVTLNSTKNAIVTVLAETQLKIK